MCGCRRRVCLTDSIEEEDNVRFYCKESHGPAGLPDHSDPCCDVGGRKGEPQGIPGISEKAGRSAS